MTELRRAFGAPLSALIVFLVGVWILGLIAAPQIIMIEQSFWTMQRPDGAAELSAKIDGLYNRLDVLALDHQSAADATARAAIDTERDTVRAEIATLEARETTPVKTWTLSNYGQMGQAHLAIFAKTILASLAVTAIAFVVCYPIAFAIAKLEPPRRAAMIMMALIVPYALNELLRVFAWQMILNYGGPINAALGLVGIGPVPFLESGSGVFIAMVYAYILFMVFPLYNVLETLDTHQIEAARDLGAGTLQIHRRVVLPHARPGIAVGCIMTFMLSAGSYAVPYIMTRGTADPWFTQLVYNRFFQATNWNVGAAYALSLLVVCTGFIFLMMRLLKVRLKDIAK
ncbi:Binding-protein-dependent transport systems inner membrane component [Roseovarius sp. EC-HK134]|uniref:ABC transporter permease n=1 Tax=unclassified Roseovarius TaxID=2614913 RepID=UPI0012545903|nr:MULTISPECIES: ABC transporter permease [unclassified Roseovarius]VVT03691.1 Binding-protein-dependent transport systems inner membrane component [Roseovarius sp. EC-HK134]VVT04091.1 Binding-protein-dependent transport systems inner membrane component [Roseovarius sp. EC-SD190]